MECRSLWLESNAYQMYLLSVGHSPDTAQTLRM
jgi:hypothetical protein